MVKMYQFAKDSVVVKTHQFATDPSAVKIHKVYVPKALCWCGMDPTIVKSTSFLRVQSRQRSTRYMYQRLFPRVLRTQSWSRSTSLRKNSVVVKMPKFATDPAVVKINQFATDPVVVFIRKFALDPVW